MTIHEVKQGTPEWLALRLGKFTASNASDLMSKMESRGYQNLINSVVYEILTGEIPESFESPAMRRGKELEPAARNAYMLKTGNWVDEVGFVEMNSMVGCSPDGLIGEEGLLEIKIPLSSTHIDYLLDGKVPSNYIWQMQFQMMVTDRKWCDFWSWSPKLKPMLVRVSLDEKKRIEIQDRLNIACEEAKKRIKILKG